MTTTTAAREVCGTSPGRPAPRKTAFEWVDLKSSLQWSAFQRTVALLRGRGNDVLVIIAPFNVYMIADRSLGGYRAIQSGVSDWLEEQGVPQVAPDELPSELYADASHPLTAGYNLLARQIGQDKAFRKWTENVLQPRGWEGTLDP